MTLTQALLHYLFIHSCGHVACAQVRRRVAALSELPYGGQVRKLCRAVPCHRDERLIALGQRPLPDMTWRGDVCMCVCVC